MSAVTQVFMKETNAVRLSHLLQDVVVLGSHGGIQTARIYEEFAMVENRVLGSRHRQCNWIDYSDVVRQTRLRRQRSEVRRLEHTLTVGA
jgi:hypothetical protein